MQEQKIPTVNLDAELKVEQKSKLNEIKAGLNEELVPREPRTAEERQMLEQLKKKANEDNNPSLAELFPHDSKAIRELFKKLRPILKKMEEEK